MDGVRDAAALSATGAEGVDGGAGPSGGDRTAGAGGAARDGVLDVDGGGSTASETATLVYAHAAGVAQGGALRFNVIRLGDETKAVDVDWQVEAAPGKALSPDGFAGGAASSGRVRLSGEEDLDGVQRGFVQSVEIALAPGVDPDDVRFTLARASPEGGGASALGTATVSASSIVVQAKGPTNGDDELEGGPGRDRSDALAGNDLVKALGEADRLDGGGGKDMLRGGGGKDRLIAGGGRDDFDFRRSDGADVILDFEDGIDRIQMAGVKRLRQIDIEQHGRHALIDYGRGSDAIRLKKTDADDLAAADFLFG